MARLPVGIVYNTNSIIYSITSRSRVGTKHLDEDSVSIKVKTAEVGGRAICCL